MRHRRNQKHRDYAKARRAANKAAGLCLNGSGHGPPTHGVRCAKCHETHRRHVQVQPATN